jgi:hypothetical protein
MALSRGSVAVGTFAVSSLFASQAFAGEFGVIRPLQTGPVGDSPQYADVENIEGEANAKFGRTWGKYTINDDPDAKVSGATIRTNIAAGGGFAPTKNFALTGYVNMTLASDTDEEAKRRTPKSTLDSGLYKHEASLFGMYRGGSVVVGGGLGVLIVGSETREFSYNDSKYTQEVSSAAMPLVRIFGGLSTKELDLTGGLRLFSMGEAVVKSEDPNKDKNEYDIVRRNPGEIHFDGRLKFAQASIAGSVAYVLTGQASEQVDEFSLRYEQIGNSNQRRTGDARRNKNHFRVGFGGSFNPVKMVGIMGGLSYIQESYAEEQFASLEHENLGGFRLDLGGKVNVQKFNGFLHLGYLMDNRVSYTAEDNGRSSTNVDRTQRAPVSQGDKVKVSQGAWDIMLGGGVAL